MKRRVILTHYDTDGCACNILLSKIFKFEKSIQCGYGKIKKKINNGDLKGYDSCVVTDISLTPEQFSNIHDDYGNRFLYVDHHKTSIESIGTYKDDNNIWFSTNFSATAIIFQKMYKYLKEIPNINEFVQCVDAYDMWRFKTYPEQFSKGYVLNILFWKYGFYDFRDRFFSSMSFDFDEQEVKWINTYKKERDKAINTSEMTDFGNNSLLVVGAPKMYINDYTLQYQNYDFYYIIYINTDGKAVLSLRANVDVSINVDIGGIVRDVKDRFGCIDTAGGHPKSAGIDFNDKASSDDILDIVEEINNIVEEYNGNVE